MRSLSLKRKTKGKVRGFFRLQLGPPRLWSRTLVISIYINDLPASMTSRCYLFTDEIKLICPSNYIAIFLWDLRQTFSTDRWGIQLYVAKCQQFHLGLSVAPDLNMYNNTGGLLPLPRVERISDLGVVIDLFRCPR